MSISDYVDLSSYALMLMIWIIGILRVEKRSGLGWVDLKDMSNLPLFKYAPIAVALYPLIANVFPSGSLLAYYISGIIYIFYRAIYFLYCPYPIKTSEYFHEYEKRGFTESHIKEWNLKYGIDIQTYTTDKNNNSVNLPINVVYWSIIDILNHQSPRARFICSSLLLLSAYPIVVSFIISGIKAFSGMRFPLF